MEALHELIRLSELLAGPLDDDTRIQLLQLFYSVGRGTMHSIMIALDNEPKGSRVYIVARDSLQAMHGFLTEELTKYGEPPPAV